MARLFVGNFDFEQNLAVGCVVQRPVALTRIIAELSPVWAAIAAEGDVLWCPQPIGPAFFEQLQQHGLPFVRSVSITSDVPPGLELVPWGWTDEVIRWGRTVGAIIDAPPLDVVRTVNSRRFSHRLEQEWGVGLEETAVAESLTGLFDAIGRLPTTPVGWVVKAEFSNSSRERYLHRGDRPFDRDSLTRWAKRRLAAGQSLFVEPWVERVEEVGVQLTLPRNGKPRVEGVTRLLTDDTGQYRGSEFTPALDDDTHWRDAVTIALDVAQAVQQTGYFGPLGIDAMRCRDATGNIHLRPIQDINARWTMGRLSLGFRSLLHSGEQGTWLHGPRAHSSCQQGSEPHPKVREIVTSPESIGGQPVRLCSTIRIVDPS